jgi:uncharacterized protein (DUF433 family)
MMELERMKANTSEQSKRVKLSGSNGGEGASVKANGSAERTELGRFIVADPKICHGKPTYKGTRIMVWQVLAMLERGESWDYIRKAWDGRVSDEAIAETIHLARKSLLDAHGRLAGKAAELAVR